MVIPATGYYAEGRKQTLNRSDWPIYAAVSALLSSQTFGSNGKPVVRDWLKSQDIPYSRQDYWLEALAGKHTVCDGVTGTLHVPDVYQIYAANQMSNAGGVLAMGCGLGKTLTAEIYAAAVSSKLRGKPLVIATTLTAFNAWKPYLKRFEAMGYSKVFLVSIDSLHKFEPGFPADGGLLILDESHLLGSVTARRTRFALRLRLKMDDALCLTGTMFHGGIARGLVNLNMAVPGLAAFSSVFNAATHFNCIQNVHVGDKIYTKIVKPQGKDHERFVEFVSRRFVCALTKRSPIAASCVNVPEQDVDTVEFGGPWLSVHEEAKKEIRRAIDNNEGIPHIMAVMQRMAHSGIEEKAEYILDLLSDGEPLVVFSQYHESLDYLETKFKEEGITYARIDGSVVGDARARVEHEYSAASGQQCLLGQHEAAGISISLVRSRRSVATDISWKPEAYDQSLARTCRRGQAHRCRHTDLVSNSFQSAILQRIRLGMAFDSSVSAYQDVRRASGL